MNARALKRAARDAEYNELVRDRILEKTASDEMVWRVKKEYESYTVFTGRFSAHKVEAVVYPHDVVLKLQKSNNTLHILYDTRNMRVTEGATPGILRRFGELLAARHAATKAHEYFKEILSRSMRLPGTQFNI